MNRRDQEALRRALAARREELAERLERIKANLKRGLDADSAERAKQLEDRDVVDALGNDARQELQAIAATLSRMATGEFGICVTCREAIEDKRLQAYPYAAECIRCASTGGRRSA